MRGNATEVQSVLFNGHDNLDHDNHADGDGWEALSRDGDAVKLINRMMLSTKTGKSIAPYSDESSAQAHAKCELPRLPE